MNEAELCRLCALQKNDFIPIYDNDGIRLQVAVKIKKLLNIEVAEDANLPKRVCLDCLYKLEMLDHFVESSARAQITLSLLFPPDKDPLESLHSIDDFKGCQNEENKQDSGESERDRPSPPEQLPPQESCFNTISTTLDDSGSKECDTGISLFDALSPPGGSLEGFPLPASDTPREHPLHRLVPSLQSTSFLCTDCSEVAMSIEELEKHHAEEHGQAAKFMCPVCSKMFSTHREYELHVKRHAIPSCEFCGKDFNDKKALEKHRKTHSMARPFACGQCGKSFRVQSALFVHAKCHLPDDAKEKFPCPMCDKKLTSKANLLMHTRIHEGIRNFTCDQCGKGFVQKGNLDSHLLTHSVDKPFVCPDCHRTFKSGVLLKKHRTVHTGDRPYQCDVCGKAFRERKTLREHQRVHTGALPYPCDYCGKAFRFKGVLATHKRQHTGERPYSCEECQHHFTDWPNYSKHMRRRHGVVVSGQRSTKSVQPPVQPADDILYSGEPLELFQSFYSLDPESPSQIDIGPR